MSVKFYPDRGGKHKYIALIPPDKWNKVHPKNPIEYTKTVRFGGIRKNGEPYEQYQDKIGYYSDFDHLDKARRKNYRNRHTAITMNRPEDGVEVPAYQYKYSPAWFSYHYLW